MRKIRRKRDMNSNKCSLRPVGQRSTASKFLFRASNRSSDCEKNVEVKVPNDEKGSKLSLSDFLNRKLHRNSVLPSSVQGKKLSFSSPVSGGDHMDRGAKGETGKKNGEAMSKFSLYGVVNMLKNVVEIKKDYTGSSANETEILDEGNVQRTRKRKNQFEGAANKPSASKRVAVLGDDSKPTGSRRGKNLAFEEPKPLFNHYENGGGWWDDNMAGVDSKEVGNNDVWEGVGCTTLGGIEWH